MRRGFAVAVFLSAYLVSVRADSTPSATIPGSQVIENRLLPILPPSGSFVTPAFKFFEDNKLVDVKSRLPSAGWAKASILLVTVRME
jgi:hypothetical protein